MLFTFPSQYLFTIGLWGVFSLTGWSRLIHAEFLVLRATQDTATNHILTCTGLSPSMVCLSRQLPIQIFLRCRSPTTPTWLHNHDGLGFSAFARHYSRNHFLFSLPRGTKMFQFPRFAPYFKVTGLQPDGLPHSEIFGSILVCKYPKLIAAYHVLHRLPEPRHPPFALPFFFLF